jgi:hypothetical protein
VRADRAGVPPVRNGGAGSDGGEAPSPEGGRPARRNVAAGSDGGETPPPEGGRPARRNGGAASDGGETPPLFGGFSSPRATATGYPWHSNIAAPGKPCGSIAYCAPPRCDGLDPGRARA